MPTVIIIAGPNGAGKTTFANEYLAADERQFEFVNADEIARSLPEGARSDVLAGRKLLTRIDALVEEGADFVVETTLASLTYAQKISTWQKRGYRISLIYIRLGSAADSLARVRKRMEAGGHGIPEQTILRRFSKSLRYFETIYKPIVDTWYTWESRDGAFQLVDSLEPS